MDEETLPTVSSQKRWAALGVSFAFRRLNEFAEQALRGDRP